MAESEEEDSVLKSIRAVMIGVLSAMMSTVMPDRSAANTLNNVWP